MKIRDGFVTNSSSTNFLIISKKELTKEYLLKKLGFKKDSDIYGMGENLCSAIVKAANESSSWHDFNYENIKETFGKKSADKFADLKDKGYNIYIGHTRSDEYNIICFMTCDYFLIDSKDFYMDGRNCTW